MIKAKITIFDDETGRIYEENKVIVPDRIEVSRFDESSPFHIKDYIFHFGETIITIEEDKK